MNKTHKKECWLGCREGLKGSAEEITILRIEELTLKTEFTACLADMPSVAHVIGIRPLLNETTSQCGQQAGEAFKEFFNDPECRARLARKANSGRTWEPDQDFIEWEQYSRGF